MIQRGERPTSPGQAAEWKAELQQWQTVDQLRRRLERITDVAGDHTLDDPHLGFWREGWGAVKFGAHNGATMVRLAADPPDFEVQIGGETIGCEFVEVLDPNRRRGAELWKDRDEGARLRQVEYWSTEDAVARISDVIANKTAKPYPERYQLVVYVNLGFVADRELRPLLASAVGNAFDRFRGVTFIYSSNQSPVTVTAR